MGIRFCSKNKTGLPFSLTSGHNIKIREDFEEIPDSEFEDPNKLQDIQFGDCDTEPNENVQNDDLSGSDSDPDDKSHPTEDTGFEFRKYGNDEAEIEKHIKISEEEQEMLKIPDKKGKKKNSRTYVETLQNVEVVEFD